MGERLYWDFDPDHARRLVQESRDKPSVARIYDYLLGGGHNFQVDRDFAKKNLATFPGLRGAAAANRAFLQRAVRFAISRGIRQFIDIGSGLPTVGNVHEVADHADPSHSCRVVYVDNEPIAHAHAQLLLAESADQRRHHAIDADYFEFTDLWEQIRTCGYIDFTQPVCLLVVALLHLMPPDLHPETVLAWYRRRLPADSLLVLSHGCNDAGDEALQRVSNNYNRLTTNRSYLRTRDEIVALFGDFELVPPGVTWVPLWRPTEVVGSVDEAARSIVLGGVGIRPS